MRTSGDGADPSRNSDADDCDASATSRDATTANPVVTFTGNKVEPELDFSTSGEFPLELRRTYNHHFNNAGLFGQHWVSSFDYQLSFGSYPGSACFPRPGGGRCGIGSATSITAWRPDGRTVKFTKAADGVFYEKKAGSVARIVNNGTAGFTVYTEDNGVETYDANGYVLGVKDAHGIGWTYSYNGTYPTRITHASGRYVDLVWSNGQLTSVRDPAGSYYGYAYHANVFGAGLHRLAATSYPGAPASTVTYHYEQSNEPENLTGISHNGVRYSSFSYSDGRVTTSSHNGRGTFSFAYSYDDYSSTFTTAVTNPLGKKAIYTYNKSKDTVEGQPSPNCPAGDYSEINYDIYGYPRLISDRNGNITTLKYNAKGQLLEQVEGYGTPEARKTVNTWDPVVNRLASATVGGVPTGTDLYRVEYTYTSDNRLETVARVNLSANGLANNRQVTVYTYTRHPNGMLQSVTVNGPVPGDEIVTRYSAVGDVLSTTNALGYGTTFSGHNALGRPGRVTGPNGDVTDYGYDPRGRVTRKRTYWNGTAQDTTVTYDEDGRVATTTTPDGVTVDYAYTDADRDRLTAVGINSTGVLTGSATREEHRLRYDAMGGVEGVVDATIRTYTVRRFECLSPVGAPRDQCVEPSYTTEVVNEDVARRSQTVRFDELGRTRALLGSNQQNFRFAYDDNGNVATSTDSLGRVTSYAYDALDRVIAITDPSGGVTSYRYDLGDKVTWVKDAKGLVTTYVYDGLGQIWAQHSPDTGTTTFEYDSTGLQTRISRADGSSLTMRYDTAARLAEATDGRWTRRYTYDACTNGKGRLCTIDTLESGVTTTSSGFTYTTDGRVASRSDRVYGATDKTAYTYDAMGRVTGIGYPSGISVGYGYSAGKLTVVQATVNGVTSNVASGIKYMPFGPIASWRFGNGLDRFQEWDLDGRLAAATTAGVQGLYYTYDANNLVSKISNTWNHAYDHTLGYDALGRLVADDTGSGTSHATYSFDAIGNRKSFTDTYAGVSSAYAYGGPGSRLTGVSGTGARTLGYNALGAQITESGARGSRTYDYDAFGAMSSATVNGQRTVYVTNALGERVGKAGSRRYIYAGQNQLLAEAGPGGWTSYIWLAGQPIAVVKNGAVYFVHTDHLGRPEVATDVSGGQAWRASLGSYGRSVIKDQIGGLPLGFPGQYYDAETDLWYNGARIYDGTTGRYMQSDPLGLNAGSNTYAYVRGNPISRIDPLGLVDWSVGIFEVTAGKGYGSGGVARFQAISECVDGEIGMASGNIAFAGATFDAIPSPVSFAGSRSDFHDNRVDIDPSVFNGRYESLAISLSFGGGVTYSGARLGDAKSDFGFGGMGGFAAGSSAVVGVAEVTSSGKLPCGCKK